jgi:nitroreductase
MEFNNAIKSRRSIRRFKPDAVPESVVRDALASAVLAPNSSNTQTWDFFWVRSKDKKAALVEACLRQSAARSAAELIVVTANPANWRRSNPFLIKWVREVQAPKPVQQYYKLLVPYMYRSGWFNWWGLIKSAAVSVAGLFRPVPRGPNTLRDHQEVAIKSAALACQNLVLSITASGYQTCMMEGFDERRVRKLLGLSRGHRVVMVIAIGVPREDGTWGAQYRLPLEMVVHEV